MDFSVAPETKAFTERVAAFVRDEVFPLENQLMKTDFLSVLPDLQAVRKRAQSKNLWAPQLPSALGGQQLGFMQFVHVSEQLGHSPLGHFALNCQAPDAGNMEILQEFGSTSQKQQWLIPLSNGDIRSCFSMTEPNRPGSNPTWMTTTAQQDGTDFVINGHKWFTTAADGAAFAIVMAVTNPDAEPHKRASMFLVPTVSPGYQRIRNIPCMGHAGEDWMSHAEVVYDNCRVPRENLIGDVGDGFTIAQARLGPGRIHHCMRWLGICERAFDIMCQRAASREVAPGETLGARQSVQNWIAESRAEIDAARLSVLHAAWTIDQQGQKAARSEVSTIKFFVARVLTDVVDRAIQTCGALGFSDDLILSYFYRMERGARIYDGPDEVHKSAVARRILKRYKNTPTLNRSPDPQ